MFALTSPRKLWKWTAEHGEAFEKVKETIASAPVLSQPDIGKARDGTRLLVICTDASTVGLGAVLSQEEDDKQLHPVYLASKRLSNVERRYHVTDLEALAVIFAIRRFHMFIYGLLTIVLTDHQPLTALFNRNVSARVLRWSLEIQWYNLEYVKGKTSVVADALSRCAAGWSSVDSVTGVEEAVVNAVQANVETKWVRELKKDGDFAEIVDEVSRGETDGVKTWAES